MTKKKKVQIVDFGHFEINDSMFIRHVFYWYDGPMLFTCEYTHPYTGKIYLLGMMTADDKFICVTMSRKRCINVENNVTSIRQAMMFPDGYKFHRQMTSNMYLLTQYMIVDNLNDPCEKWQAIARGDVISNDWIFIGGFNWYLTAAEKRKRRK